MAKIDPKAAFDDIWEKMCKINKHFDSPDHSITFAAPEFKQLLFRMFVYGTFVGQKQQNSQAIKDLIPK